MMQEPIIKILNLSKIFQVGKEQITALKNVDLEIIPGEFLVIYGPSGCGKTTLLSLLAGLDKPTQGNVLVRNKDIFKLRSNELARYRRTRIGMVFQDFNLIPSLNAQENVAMPLILAGINSREARKRAKELLQTLGMGDRIAHKPNQLSGGQKQRVAIARALVSNPGILLIDEPTGNLDIPRGNEIMEILQKINETWGRTIILVTHNPNFLNFGNRVIYLEDGKVIKEVNNRKVRIAEKNFNLKSFFSNRFGSLSFWETLRLAKNHFFSKKLRTFLTTLGVALGVGAIVGLVSLGVGLQQITANQLASMDMLVSIGVSANQGSSSSLNEQTSQAISQINNVVLVSPMISLPAKATFNNETTQVVLNGLKPEAIDFEGINLISGKNYDNKEGIIISKAILKNFNLNDPQAILNKKLSLTITLTPEGSNDLSQFKLVDLDEPIIGVSNDESTAAVYVSLDSLKKLTQTNVYSSLKIKVSDRGKVEMVRDKIEALGFTTSSVVDLIKKVDQVFLIVQIVLGVIGGVALIVALIGIVNIMTVALLERTHEVGILKAIGATDHNIKMIFLYEVLLYGLFGSIFGILIALGLGVSINTFIEYLMKIGNITGTFTLFVTPFYFSLEMVFLTILVSLLGGWYPAKRASKLSPMEALRYE